LNSSFAIYISGFRPGSGSTDAIPSADRRADVDAVFSAGEYGGDLWIQPLSDAVADRPRGGGENPFVRRIDDLNGVVVDIYPRSDLSKLRSRCIRALIRASEIE
ncbi:MAG: hypothetical protein IPG58_09655, partial [Acidobacteria bacterium]|nr:hypothetical protein [Acidobacteriota bacterium]